MIYKLTFFDKVSIPFCSSTVSFFTDNPESFEQCYFYRSTTAQDDKQVRTLDNEDQYKRYQRSKNGEMVSDYYCNLPELNIFQYDETAKIQLLKEITLKDQELTLYNVHNCPGYFYVSDGWIQLATVKFKEMYHLIGKYHLSGLCQKPSFVENMDGNYGYQQFFIYGNPIFYQHKIPLQPRKANPEDFYYRSDFPKEMLKNDWLETCCWLPITESPDLLTLEDLPEDYMNILMRDILGEAG